MNDGLNARFLRASLTKATRDPLRLLSNESGHILTNVINVSRLIDRRMFSNVHRCELCRVKGRPTRFARSDAPIGANFRFLRFSTNGFTIAFGARERLLTTKYHLLCLFHVFNHSNRFLLLRNTMNLRVFLRRSRLFPVDFHCFFLSTKLIRLANLICFKLLVFQRQAKLPHFHIIAFPANFLPNCFVLTYLMFVICLTRLLLRPLNRRLGLHLIVLPLRPNRFLTRLFEGLFTTLNFFLHLIHLLPFNLKVLVLAKLSLIMLLFNNVGNVLRFFHLLLGLLAKGTIKHFLGGNIVDLRHILMFLFYHDRPIDT